MTVSSRSEADLVSQPHTRTTRALLAATVVGFLVPNAMVIAFVITEGVAPVDYFAAWVDSLPSTQLAVDLAICSVVFIGWSAVDGRRLGVRWWITIPATFLVGLCFAIPLYLLLRERAVLAVPEGGVVDV
jgi:hypothetical protein